MNPNVYRWCAVPQCNNTSIKTPNKLFVNVPMKKKVRKMWLTLARRDPTTISSNSVFYFCEDHFDLPNDMENYIQYRVMGSVSQVRMKPGCIPTRFECQPDRRKRTSNTTERPYFLKKQRRMLIENIEKDLAELSKSSKHLESSGPSAESTGLSQTASMVTIKLEVESDSGDNAPLSSIGLQQGLKALKTEPKEESVESPSHSAEATSVGDVKCEYESDPEHDDELRRISLERRPVKTEQAAGDIKEGVACDQEASAEKRRRAADNSSNKTRAARGAPPRTGDARHQCSVCHKYYSRTSCLKTHLKTHTGEKPYQCDVCQKRFTVKCNLQAHYKIHTGEKPFKCNICQRRFSTKESLQKHILTHTGEKPFECNICQCRFTQRSNLQKHILSHTGEKPFECNICQRRFAHKNILKQHTITHTGEKSFECYICHRRFAHKCNLQKHIILHTGEKSFECNICHRRFAAKKTLQSHVRKHTGEKPFECNICQRRFAAKKTLQSHILTHTGEKPFECNICHHRFARKASLQRHLRSLCGKNLINVENVSTDAICKSPAI